MKDRATIKMLTTYTQFRMRIHAPDQTNCINIEYTPNTIIRSVWAVSSLLEDALGTFSHDAAHMYVADT